MWYAPLEKNTTEWDASSVKVLSLLQMGHVRIGFKKDRTSRAPTRVNGRLIRNRRNLRSLFARIAAILLLVQFTPKTMAKARASFCLRSAFWKRVWATVGSCLQYVPMWRVTFSPRCSWFVTSNPSAQSNLCTRPSVLRERSLRFR